MLEICFIAYQDQRKLLIGVVFCFVDPIRNVIERVTVCDIINQDSPNRTSVVGPGNGLEYFLSCLNLNQKGTVSQICSLILYDPTSITFDPNSTPTVV